MNLSKLKNKFSLNTIKNKIFYFTIIALILSNLFIILSSYSISYETIKNTSISREKKSLELVSNQIDILLNSAEFQYTNLITNHKVQNILSKINRSKSYPTEEQVTVLKETIDSIVYSSSIISGVILHSVEDFKIKSNTKFNEILFSPNYTIPMGEWYGPIFDIRQNPYVYICKKINDMNTGKLLGYLEVFIAEKNISKNYDSSTYNNFSSFSIINKNGVVLSSLAKDEINEYIDIKSEHTLNIKSFEDISFKRDTRENTISLGSFNEMLNSTILVELHLDDVIIGHNIVVTSLATIFLISIVISYVISKIISENITKPILKLQGVMASVKRGEWDIDNPYTDTNNEISDLYATFKNLIEHIRELMKKLNLKEQQKKKFELELMQLQIKPHFLYNSLENISALTELELNDEAVDMIENLSTFYRGILSKGDSIITIEKELEITNSYLSIMKTRYSDIFDYKINFDENVLEMLCPKLLIQPLVENSIYHGLKNSDTKGLILVEISLVENKIIFEISDSGIGISNEDIEKIIKGKRTNKTKNGFAVKNIIDRLDLFYKDDYDFKIESYIGIGTKIQIAIPIKLEGDLE